MVAALAPGGVGRAGDALLSIAGLSRGFGLGRGDRVAAVGPRGAGQEAMGRGPIGATPTAGTVATSGRPVTGGTALGVGIRQFGGPFPFEPLFDGVTLPVATGIAGSSQRRRRLRPRPSQPTGIGSP